MAAQKILELEKSDLFADTAGTFELEMMSEVSPIGEIEIRKLKGVLKFSFSVIYFAAVIYLLIKLIT